MGHPAFKPHPMQGWSPDFIPKLAGDAVDMGVIDRILTIPNADAMYWSKQLAQKEGIFVGITSGATFAGAIRVCKEAPKGATVLCMLPDTGERYLSTPLFADVAVDMTDEELGDFALDSWLSTSAKDLRTRVVDLQYSNALHLALTRGGAAASGRPSGNRASSPALPQARLRYWRGYRGRHSVWPHTSGP